MARVAAAGGMRG